MRVIQRPELKTPLDPNMADVAFHIAVKPFDVFHISIHRGIRCELRRHARAGLPVLIGKIRCTDIDSADIDIR